MKYIPLLEMPLLIVLVLVRSIMLGRTGTKVIVFGVSDKTDYVIVPIALFFFYGILAAAVDVPFPRILKQPFWQTDILNICAIVFCSASLVWFAATLKAFGKSFRVGIDENTNDTLITSGTFAVSRNPIYVAFIVFFLGLFLAYPAIVTALFVVLLSAAVHRQILREERFLKIRYGSEYAEYCTNVRRYL